MTKEDLKKALQAQDAAIGEFKGALRSVIGALMPIHVSLGLFEKGGPECRKFIETTYERLLQAERTIENECFYFFDDDD